MNATYHIQKESKVISPSKAPKMVVEMIALMTKNNMTYMHVVHNRTNYYIVKK
jgi:hypothetical protein